MSNQGLHFYTFLFTEPGRSKLHFGLRPRPPHIDVLVHSRRFEQYELEALVEEAKKKGAADPRAIIEYLVEEHHFLRLAMTASVRL